MSDDEQTTAMVNWEERLAAEANEDVSHEQPATPVISLRAGVMTYMEEPIPDNTLTCIVLGSVVEHAYYDTDFDPDVIRPPRCFALARPEFAKEMVPHEDVPETWRQSEACESCEQFQWGSGRGRGKACSTRRRLALIPTDELDDPEKLAAADIIRMTISVTNVQTFSKYMMRVAANNRPVWSVITQVTCKPNPKTQYQLSWDLISMLDHEYLPALSILKDRALQELMVPFDMSYDLDNEPEPEKKSGRGRKY